MGSLAGAAYLLKSNGGVQSITQKRQKRFVEHKGKSYVEIWIQHIHVKRKLGLMILNGLGIKP